MSVLFSSAYVPGRHCTFTPVYSPDAGGQTHPAGQGEQTVDPPRENVPAVHLLATLETVDKHAYPAAQGVQKLAFPIE